MSSKNSGQNPSLQAKIIGKDHSGLRSVRIILIIINTFSELFTLRVAPAIQKPSQAAKALKEIQTSDYNNNERSLWEP